MQQIGILLVLGLPSPCTNSRTTLARSLSLSLPLSLSLSVFLSYVIIKMSVENF